MATLKNVLRPQEAQAVEGLYKFLCNGLQDVGNIWGERPYLHRGRILFENRGKNIITAVEMYFVLGGLYRNGNYYKITPLTEFPGRFTYEHKLIPYRLSPKTWHKAAEKFLVGALEKLITERNYQIPSSVSKLVVKEGPRSIQILCRFEGQKSSTLSLLLTPAVEGNGWPIGYERPTIGDSHAETARWFLVPPNDSSDTSKGWELVFPSAVECVMPNMTTQAALMLSWMAEKRGWRNMGLHNPSAAFHALASNVAVRRAVGDSVCMHHHVKLMLAELLIRMKVGSLNDFNVAAMDYLAGTTSRQRKKLTRDVEAAMKEMEFLDGFKRLTFDYPLLMPEEVHLRGGSFDDLEHLGSQSNSGWQNYGKFVERASGENACQIIDMPPPSIDETSPVPKVTIFDQEMDVSHHASLISAAVKNRRECRTAGHVLGLLLTILLIAGAVVFALSTVAERMDCIRDYVWGQNGTEITSNTTNGSVSPETEILPTPLDLRLTR